MTPLPKRKHSKQRSRVRRATLATKLPNLVVCSNCGVRKLAHRTCFSCGFYNGKAVLKVAEPIKVKASSNKETAEAK